MDEELLVQEIAEIEAETHEEWMKAFEDFLNSEEK